MTTYIPEVLRPEQQTLADKIMEVTDKRGVFLRFAIRPYLTRVVLVIRNSRFRKAIFVSDYGKGQPLQVDFCYINPNKAIYIDAHYNKLDERMYNSYQEILEDVKYFQDFLSTGKFNPSDRDKIRTVSSRTKLVSDDIVYASEIIQNVTRLNPAAKEGDDSTQTTLILANGDKIIKDSKQFSNCFREIANKGIYVENKAGAFQVFKKAKFNALFTS